MVSRLSRLKFIVLGITVLLLPWTLGALALYSVGITFSDMRFENGIVVDRWQKTSQGCVSLEGRNLKIAMVRPLSLSLDKLTLYSCPSADEPSQSLPWTPDFDLTVKATRIDYLPFLPTFALSIKQRSNDWNISAQHSGDNLTLDIDRLTGEWQANGELKAQTLLDDLNGKISLTAKGAWQSGIWRGELIGVGTDLGMGKHPQTADLSIKGSLAQPHWQLLAELDEPIALNSEWQLQTQKPVFVAGDFSGINTLSANLLATSQTDTATLSIDNNNTGTLGGSGMLSLTGKTVSGALPISWTPEALTLSPSTLTFSHGAALTLQHETLIPLKPAGEVALTGQLKLKPSNAELIIKTNNGILSWNLPDWKWSGPLAVTGNVSGYDITGGWRGQFEPSGFSGEPITLQINDRKTNLKLVAPIKDFNAPNWETLISADGSVSGMKTKARLHAELNGHTIFEILESNTAHLKLDATIDSLHVSTPPTTLSWSTNQWALKGGINAKGKVAGIDINGAWAGNISPRGAQGKPLVITIADQQLALNASVPVTHFKPPQWASTATLTGHAFDYPINGQIGIHLQGMQPSGLIKLRSQIPKLNSGGQIDLNAPWRFLKGQLQLASKSTITLNESLFNDILIKPVIATTQSPLIINKDGVYGQISAVVPSLVAPTWQIPESQLNLTLNGLMGHISGAITSWQTDMSTSVQVRTKPRFNIGGDLQINTPLNPAMTRSMGFTLNSGSANGKAQWSANKSLHAQGELNVIDAAVNWGDIPATGANAALQFQTTETGLRFRSRAPITIKEIDIGTPISNIQLSLRSNLNAWRFSDVSANALGGRLEAPTLTWPSPDEYQPVTITGLDLEQVAAIQNKDKPVIALSGKVGGIAPLRIRKTEASDTKFSVKNGVLENQGPLVLKVLPSDPAQAMRDSNFALKLAVDTLSLLNVHNFSANIDMAESGWLNGKMTIKGVNPEQGGVVLNYTHQQNILELLRSLRVGDEISQNAMERQQGSTTQ